MYKPANSLCTQATLLYQAGQVVEAFERLEQAISLFLDEAVSYEYKECDIMTLVMCWISLNSFERALRLQEELPVEIEFPFPMLVRHAVDQGCYEQAIAMIPDNFHCCVEEITQLHRKINQLRADSPESAQALMQMLILHLLQKS
ncbi:hypothetical protein [Pseudomonas sp. JZ134]|uniref:hypothetical protein n=1 Tax=Pseudomonas sp. JZ134 TaxID=2806615 RepID=UPI003DA039AF